VEFQEVSTHTEEPIRDSEEAGFQKVMEIKHKIKYIMEVGNYSSPAGSLPFSMYRCSRPT
jgi:hypothetical protein